MYALIVEPLFRRAALLEAAAAAEALDTAHARDNDETRAILDSRGPPAVCIVELTGANLDGFGLLAMLRDRTTHAPVVVVSAFSALRDSAWALRESLNIVSVHRSDLTTDALRASLRVALGRHGGRPLVLDPLPPAVREQVRVERVDSICLAAGGVAPESLQRRLDEAAAFFGVDATLCTLRSANTETLLAFSGPRAHRFVERIQGGAPSGFAAQVVDATGSAALVLNDASQNPAFAGDPLVKEGLVRGFAGVALEASDGTPLGALCLVDTRPLRLDAAAIVALRAFASRVAGELDVIPARARGLASGVEPRFTFQHLAAVLDGLDQPVTLWGANDRILAVNPVFTHALGLSPGSLRGGRVAFAEHMARAGADAEFVELVRALPPPPVVQRAEVTVGGLRPRVYRWSTKPVLLEEGMGQLDVWLDITAERELERAALTDALTGIANRRGGEVACTREVARTRRAARPLSFLLLDIDNFKRVNDAHGHAAGDEVIRGVATIMSQALRASDVAARWGGEELLAILPDADIVQARVVAERVRTAVAAAPLKPPVTVSIGTAQLGPTERADAAIGRADSKLYEAKERGRNRVL
ncbi:hypothetical protein LBMAG42_26930 [Deltaproteobacteria bacterium]|nr:hypothetical protein LBMAG42_26930 [Deltaproteobacteria bacterium]